MNRLLYVIDDQQTVLDATVLLLRTLGSDWEVLGFSDPLAALAAVQHRSPDLVLSDHQMTPLRGGQVLEEVRRLTPNAVRIIMSGYVDLKTLAEVVSAHQYIAKPFDVFKLRELIQRAFDARGRMHQRGMLDVVTSLRSIPSLPHLYYRLMDALNSDDRTVDAIAEIVATDPGLSSKVLQLANSPMFGRGSLASNPADAVLCLGTEIIRAIALSQEVFKNYARLKSPEIDLPRLWHHSLAVAQIAQRICAAHRPVSAQADAAFLAGILHEIGKLILLDNFPGPFLDACAAARSSGRPLAAELFLSLHATPSAVAAYLFELWGLGPDVVAAVAAQDDPQPSGGGTFSIAAALYIADYVVSRRAPSDPFATPDWHPDWLPAAGCPTDYSAWADLERLVEPRPIAN